MKRRQYGRSMIEMLGVLAIIGVLSIGGIALYRRAVNHHQANSILDDANRYAFAITEHDRGYLPYEPIEGINFDKTSTYFMNAFTDAKSGQFGIMVTDVPRGVCEALLDKASVDYKIRVLEATDTADTTVLQLSATGVIYDNQNTDICESVNDIVLYFGDTADLFNSAGEECSNRTDCSRGYFCTYANATSTDKIGNGNGVCKSIASFKPETKTMSDGRTWTRSVSGMNWFSAMEWCEALGKKLATRKDVEGDTACVNEQPCSSAIMSTIREGWSGTTNYWLNAPYYDYATRTMSFKTDANGTDTNVIGSAWKIADAAWYKAFCRD